MKSIKFIVAAAAVAMSTAVMAAADSLLYWMVDQPQYEDSPIDFDYVKVKAFDGGAGSYLYVFDQKGSTGYLDAYRQDAASTTGGIYSGLFDGETVDYFLVELYDASDVRVAWQSVSYSKAFNNGSIATVMAPGGANVYAISQVVPEPTSGVLLLVGLAGLALRRKKA